MWGNNRSPNNDYTAGSTSALGFETPSKTVYFDHLVVRDGVSIANEAFTGESPGVGDIAAWIFLANEGVVKPGVIINFQNEVGRSISESNTNALVRAGYQVSVVPFGWWLPCLLQNDFV
jgi:hypothetical protein